MVQQTGKENTQTYQVELVIVIVNQIVVTNLKGNMQQQEGRVNHQILGVKALTVHNERVTELDYELYLILALVNIKTSQFFEMKRALFNF